MLLLSAVLCCGAGAGAGADHPEEKMVGVFTVFVWPGGREKEA